MRTPEEMNALLDRVESLLSQFDEANDRFDRGEWNKKYGERLGPYCDKLKTLNGDDFDLMKESFDEYHKDYSDVSDDEYVDHLEDNIKKVIERIWPEAPEEVKEEAAEQIAEAAENPEDGAVTETHIETEDKNGDGEIQPDEVETHTVSEDELESDANAKTRYEKRSASNKSKLAGWDPQKRLGSDEEIKEEPGEEKKEVDPMAEFQKSLDEEYAKIHR